MDSFEYLKKIEIGLVLKFWKIKPGKSLKINKRGDSNKSVEGHFYRGDK